MYGINENCPIRIISISGYSKEDIEAYIDRMIEEFQWQIYSRGELRTVERVVYSVTLFNLNPTKEN